MAGQAMQDHKSRTQVQPRSRRAARLALMLFCAGLITVGAVFYLWQRYQYIRLGFEVAALRAQLEQLERRLEPLQVEADFLSRPERIDALARDTLGLVPPVPSQVIVVEQDVPAADLSR
ncbi:MAG: cell division protein FtsL [Candidatus Lambdaproteobacteria bacterium]|nr:cell division protein FtsL [Candidatus Lambdaproteobacteria bacterium]